jgi:hypothetical protein
MLSHVCVIRAILSRYNAHRQKYSNTLKSGKTVFRDLMITEVEKRVEEQREGCRFTDLTRAVGQSVRIYSHRELQVISQDRKSKWRRAFDSENDQSRSAAACLL